MLSRRLFLLACALAGLLLLFPGVRYWAQSQISVGYVLLDSDTAEDGTNASGLFSFRNPDGVLIWEAGVEAVPASDGGRILVDESGAGLTALALVNSSDEAASVLFTLRDTVGNETASAERVLGPGEHQALFVNQLFPLAESFRGTLTFQERDSRPVLGAVTLRQNTNHHGDVIFSTLPVAPLEPPQAAQTAVLQRVIPHLGAGQGLSTGLVLLNTSAAPVRGTLEFFASSGDPLQVELAGQSGSLFEWEIPAAGLFQEELASSGEVMSGYAVLTLQEGTALPVAAGLFRFREGDSTVTEAGIFAGNRTKRLRILVDQGGTRTGLALASAGNPRQTVRYRLLDQYSQLLAETTRELPAGGHVGIFVDELFPQLPPGFTGLMDVEADEAVTAISLKLTINQRFDPVLTTLPVIDLENPGPGGLRIFPQFGFGEGFSTRLILFAGTESRNIRLSFVETQTGSPLALSLGSRFGSSFDLTLQGGSTLQLRPGDSTPVSEVLVDGYLPLLEEVVVDEGNHFHLRPRVVDEAGRIRDDFELEFSSLDQQVATISPEGIVEGIDQGFSTLAIRAGGIETQGLITVVEVEAGRDTGGTASLVQDAAGRIYLTRPATHVIEKADSIQGDPRIFAGMSKLPGLRNGPREQALFRNPSFLAFDASDGFLYVSDSGNHVIRRILPKGLVETLAGDGPQAGFRDGPANEALFRDPQGIALDNRGSLYVVDSGNHAIRRIHLATGQVETVAGGQRGFADAFRADARFDTPIGITLESSSFITSFNGIRGEDVALLVADSGNGRVRRVFGTGQVETLSRGEFAPAGIAREGLAQSEVFADPTDVAVDASGSIYVTETDAGRTRVLLRNGTQSVVSQPGSAARPYGISIAKSGQALVADEIDSTRQITFGRPELVSIVPDSLALSGDRRVRLRGRNFSPDTIVIIGSRVINNLRVEDSQTISFDSPPLEASGLQNLTLSTRGGTAQALVTAQPPRLSELEPGYITTVAGGSTFVGDGFDPLVANLNSPEGMVFDNEGNLLFADGGNLRVRKLDFVSGVITTLAGDGLTGFSNNTPAVGSRLFRPYDLAVDAFGNIFVSNSVPSNLDTRIRTIEAGTGLIKAIAASCIVCTLAVGADGDLLISDRKSLRKINLNTGSSTTLQIGLTPSDMVVSPAGDVYVSARVDGAGSGVVYRVDLESGEMVAVAGNGSPAENSGQPPFFGGRPSFEENGMPATEVALSFDTFFGGRLSLGPDGDLFISGLVSLYPSAQITDFLPVILRVDADSGIIETAAGGGIFGDDDIPADQRTLGRPASTALDGVGNLYIADGNKILKVDAETGLISTAAGTGATFSPGNGGPAVGATLVLPESVAGGPNGDFYFKDSLPLSNRSVPGGIRRVRSSDGVVTRLPDTESALSFAVHSSGALYYSVADQIRKIERDQLTSELVLDGVSGIVNTDRNGGVYLGNAGEVVRLNLETGEQTRLAGNGEPGLSGDGGPALEAQINLQTYEFDARGNLFVITGFRSCSTPARVRRVDAETGVIRTVVETFPALNGCGGEGRPRAITVDGRGDIYYADNHRVFRIDVETGEKTRVAGSGGCINPNDGVEAIVSDTCGPAAIAFDFEDDLLIATTTDDLSNLSIHRIRAVRGPIP